jgi:hypothetical protein
MGGGKDRVEDKEISVPYVFLAFCPTSIRSKELYTNVGQIL